MFPHLQLTYMEDNIKCSILDYKVVRLKYMHDIKIETLLYKHSDERSVWDDVEIT